MYTLENHEKAKAERADWIKRWDNYIDKYQADSRVLARALLRIEQYLRTWAFLNKPKRRDWRRSLAACFLMPRE